MNNTISLRYIVGLVILAQIAIFAAHLFLPLKVKNEFYYVDEYTKLADGTVVSNQDFERHNLIIDPSGDNLVNKPSSLGVYQNSQFDINRTPKYTYFPRETYSNIWLIGNKFNYLVEKLKRPFYIDPIADREIFYSYPQLLRLGYERCVNYDHIASVSTAIRSRKESSRKFALDDSFPQCFGYEPNILLPVFVANSDRDLKRKLDYVEKNIENKVLQTMDRYYFHESMFILAPLNEIQLGKPLNEVFSQYGYLSVLAVSKFMDAIGGFSIPNYDKAIKFSYLAYYLIFLFVVVKIFKNQCTRLLLPLIFSIAIFINQYYFYQYSPGQSPLRHILDLLLLYSIWKFDESKDIYLVYICAAISSLSIFINKEYGMMMAAAACAAGFYYFIYISIRYRFFKLNLLFALLIFLLVSVTSIYLYPLAPNPSSRYFIDGFYSFYISPKNYFIVLFSIAFQALFVCFSGRFLFNRERLFVFLFSSLYSQLLFFYYVWGGGHAHLYSLIVIYVFPYFLLLDLINWDRTFLSRFVSKVSVVIAFVIALFYGYVFVTDWARSSHSYEVHVEYKWDIPRAYGMITTVDPDLFEDSVKILNDFSLSSEVFLISKYDSLLTTLAKKYSGAPFFELRSLIISESDYIKARDQISHSDLIFVDNDIDRDFESEMDTMLLWNILPLNFYEHRYQRILKLKVLRQLYRDVVLNKYHLIKQGALISVYSKNK